MHYLKDTAQIQAIINKLALLKTLWLDTEIADWDTSYPRLSLIQVLADPINLSDEFVYILDVLDQPDLAAYFISQIMVNPQIEKVFHNASFDVKYLGQDLALNVTCTLKLARKISREALKVSNLKLKTLAVELCDFSTVDVEEQASDWGKRPLTQKQVQYAAMDLVYLAAVHRRLLEVSNPDAVNNIFDMAKTVNSSLNPTKVRVAFECPRLFYLKEHFGGNTIFLPRDNANGIGNIFHQFADDFVNLAVTEPEFQDFLKPDPSQLQVEEIALKMQQLFYRIKFYPYLLNSGEKNTKGLLQVWQGLQQLIRRFVKLLVINRRYCSAKTVIYQTFITEDHKLKHYFKLPDGTAQRVAGQFDCLVFNFELNRLCVVEFKTYQAVDSSAQLAQVALYSYMLSAKKKVPVDSAIYCVLPDFKEYYYSWEQLESTVHQLIPYKLQQMQQWLTWEPPYPNPPPPTTQSQLCEICPQQQKCQTFFPVDRQQGYDSNNQQTNSTTNTQQLANTQLADTQLANTKATGEELVATLESFGIGVEYQGATVGPAFVRVKLKPYMGVKINTLLKLSADLQVQLGLANPPLISPQAGYVSIDLPRKDRQVAKFENYIQPNSLPPTVLVKIAIGITIEGQLVEADLSDPNTCHFLVGGTTGSGKSEFLRSLLFSLLFRHSPKNLQIALVDPKRVTFPEFGQIPWLYSPIVKDSDSAIELMDKLVAEMELRYQRFEKTGCADLRTYNQNSEKILPRIVCIFDEYADFMTDKETRTILEQSIKRLGAMARAAGIHLIIATQRPEAKVVTPIIRSNLPGRVALRTASEADSMIVLGGKQTDAANLLGKGDLLYQAGSRLLRLQSLLATNIKLPH